MEDIEDVLKVKNAYDNYRERVSFEIVAEECKKVNNITCAESTSITTLLKEVYFTFY